MELSLALKACQIHSLHQKQHIHFVSDQVRKKQREQRLSNQLAAEILSRMLKLLFWAFYFQVYQRCKSVSFLSHSAFLCWLHQTEIAIPRINVYLCLICRKLDWAAAHSTCVCKTRGKCIGEAFKNNCTHCKTESVPSSPQHEITKAVDED